MALFAATMVLSAFLLFQVQPILARAILPWFGGSAGVWTTCLLFFQAGLLGGYLYAHGIVRYLRPRTQVALHLALVAASLFFLPILPGPGWKPSGPGMPGLRILGLLSATVGLPYLLLSSTSPLLQAWYARAFPGAIPYRLFALSNAGSVLGLLSYPVAAEPLLSLRGQSWGWSAAYAAFCLLCAATALARGPGKEPEEPRAPAAGEESGGRPEGRTVLLWALLPACASTLLLAVTSHITQNVAAVPFLWILPLTLYLVTFILCFSGEGGYLRGLWLAALVPALAGMAFLLSKGYETATLSLLLPVYCGGLFTACMVCHGELARLKPHPRYLTAYYLLIAAGGAAGGLFVGLLAPALFRGYHELPLGIAACTLLAAIALWRGAGRRATERSAAARRRAGWSAAWLAYAAILSVCLVVQGWDTAARYIRAERNFYGVLQVMEDPPDPRYAPLRTLVHGTIIHGRQFLEPSRRREPTAYYGPATGAGLAFRLHREGMSRRLGVVGLGVGTLAVYAQPRDSLRFYEINPLVTRLAEEEFTFLRDAPCPVEVVHGDGRLALEVEEPQRFDLLAVDAFSGDAIPMHLLTREAFALYFRHLKPDGVLAVHITNKYLDLKPVVARLAADAGKTARLVESGEEPLRGLFGATWVLVGNGGGFLEDPRVAGALSPLLPAGSAPLWTDDYGNLLRALKL